jgi:hypothetical protein
VAEQKGTLGKMDGEAENNASDGMDISHYNAPHSQVAATAFYNGEIQE